MKTIEDKLKEYIANTDMPAYVKHILNDFSCNVDSDGYEIYDGIFSLYHESDEILDSYIKDFPEWYNERVNNPHSDACTIFEYLDDDIEYLNRLKLKLFLQENN